MTVLITGGGGMIGSFTAHEFVAAGRPVALYDRAFRPIMLAGLESVPQRVGDVTDREALFQAVRDYGITQIVHTAAALTPQAVADPAGATLINIQAILNVLEATRQHGLGRLVFASSGRVYGSGRGQDLAAPLTEDSPFNPESAYGSAKIASEFLGKNYVDAYGLEFVALRFSAVYGPSDQYGRLGFRPLRPLLEGPLNGRSPDPTPLIPGRGEMVYAPDVARAVFLAARAERLAYRAYNITSGRAYSYADLCGAACAIVGLPPEATAGVPPPTNGTPRLLDTTRARTDLGFEARFDLEASLRDHLDWLARMGYQDAWLQTHGSNG
jgi:UDP-glucose 4-epimerase